MKIINWFPYLKDEVVYLYGLEKIIEKIITDLQRRENLSYNKLAKKYNFCSRSLYYWIDGKRPIPLKIFLKIIDLSKFNFKSLLKDIQLNLEGISMGDGNRKKIVKLPFVIDEKLSYLAGYLFGDGCLKSEEYTVQFVDEYSEQINNIQELIFSLFNIKGNTIRNGNKTELIVYSKAIWLFFNKIFNMPIGTKTDINFPKIIYKDHDLKLSFVKGFIDADGGICRIEECDNIPPWFLKSPNIEIAAKTKNILEQIKTVFGDIGLKSNLYYHKSNDSYRLIICGNKNILKCNELKIFLHPLKSARLKLYCQAQVA
ncbi:hypothetical protein HYV89_00100 [Candidatus Woesearchaeota archaeon]|nr:hypothetical protein [Candidatus Woesearchaeota archaeon]